MTESEKGAVARRFRDEKVASLELGLSPQLRKEKA